MPLLQSIFAETLRLRISAFIMRSHEGQDVKVNSRLFPKGEILLIANTPPHMDQKGMEHGLSGLPPSGPILGGSVSRLSARFYEWSA